MKAKKSEKVKKELTIQEEIRLKLRRVGKEPGGLYVLRGIVRYVKTKDPDAVMEGGEIGWGEYLSIAEQVLSSHLHDIQVKAEMHHTRVMA